MEIISGVARGQNVALGRLYDQHAAVLLGVLRRLLRDKQEAEDVLHEVFLEVWEHAAEYDPARGTIRAWLVMRARSRGLDRLRLLHRARTVPNAGVDDELNPAPAPADALTIRRALSNLAPELRRLLELGYFDGLSSAEIAAREQLAVGTVKSRVARALSELRETLQPT